MTGVLIFLLKLILKIILIILAVIGILLLLILFFPVTYQITGKAENEIQAKLTLHWLFHVIHLNAGYRSGSITAVLRIFGIPLQLYPATEKKMHRKTKRNPSDAGCDESEKSDNAGCDESEESDSAGDQRSSSTKKDAYAKHDHTENEHLKTKKTGFFTKIKTAIQNFFQWIRSLPDRIASLKKNFRRIRREFTDEQNQDAVKHVLKELGYLLRHYKPSKIQMNVMFSTGDPALTGQLTGVISMFPAAYRKGNKILPDFTGDDPYLKGTFLIRGHIMAIHLVCAALRLLFDKKLRRLIRRARR